MPLIAAQCYPFAIQIRPIQPIYDSFTTHMGGIPLPPSPRLCRAGAMTAKIKTEKGKNQRVKGYVALGVLGHRNAETVTDGAAARMNVAVTRHAHAEKKIVEPRPATQDAISAYIGTRGIP